MSLSLYGVPDGQLRSKRQSQRLYPSVYSPVTALGSLSSVALSSAQALVTLAQEDENRGLCLLNLLNLSSGFLDEATNQLSSGFLREATRWGEQAVVGRKGPA